jgi:hypothetical protein
VKDVNNADRIRNMTDEEYRTFVEIESRYFAQIIKQDSEDRHYQLAIFTEDVIKELRKLCKE